MHENLIAGLGVILFCDHDARREPFSRVLDLDGAGRFDALREEGTELKSRRPPLRCEDFGESARIGRTKGVESNAAACRRIL